MKKLVFLSLALLLTLVFPLTLFAEDNLNDVQKQIEDLNQKIEAAQSQERTLNSQITGMDQKIKLTTLQIADTGEKIEKLGIEITDLNSKIERLESTLSQLSEVFLNRIVESYKLKRISYLTVLFSSHGLTDLLNRAKYIQIAQLHDQEVLTSIQLTKTNFSEQKTLRELKKQEQELLKGQLEAQQVKLNQQKKAKQALLEQTKNDEATYQRLLEQALAEKQAVEAALISGVKEGPVKVGDPIALVGNSGYPACSTGAHLHFEVRKNNQWINPGDFIKSKTVTDQQEGTTGTFGTGSWEWPLEGDVMVTQHFGVTPYSWRYAYSGGIHTGIDMYSNSSNVIRAPHDGTLYSASQNCGGASVIKIKYIDHGDGLMSFYLHVQ